MHDNVHIALIIAMYYQKLLTHMYIQYINAVKPTIQHQQN